MATKIHKLYKLAFTVEGSGHFPLDMLRYDRACPRDESASADIESRQKRKVNLVMFSLTNHGPTKDRWNSFGWNVIGEHEVLYY